MDELKLIMDAITTLGEAGKEAFIWWLVMDKGVLLICWLTFFSLLFYLIKMIASTCKSENRLEQLRRQMCIGGGTGVDSDEYRSMIDWIEARK